MMSAVNRRHGPGDPGGFGIPLPPLPGALPAAKGVWAVLTGIFFFFIIFFFPDLENTHQSPGANKCVWGGTPTKPGSL